MPYLDLFGCQSRDDLLELVIKVVFDDLVTEVSEQFAVFTSPASREQKLLDRGDREDLGARLVVNCFAHSPSNTGFQVYL